MKKTTLVCVRADAALFFRRALWLAALLVSPWAAANPVLIDHYRGWGDNSPMQPAGSNTVTHPRWLPAKAQGPYYDNIPRLLSSSHSGGTGADRFAAVQRLLALAAPTGVNAVGVGVPAAAGPALPTALAGLEQPSGSNVLCEYERANVSYAANAARAPCLNGIEGAVMHVALRVPASGYQLQIGGDDGVLVDAATAGGTAYRQLAYSAKVVAGATIDKATANANGYSNTALNRAALPGSTGDLLNLRVTWSNWGSSAALQIRWVPPGGTPQPIPASALRNPSDPATYIHANDDNFTATPIPAGTAGVTASVLGNDSVNSAPATASNVASKRLTGTPPAGITLNADGTLSVAATTAPGTHAITYEICRSGSLQPLCATATATVRVTGGAPAPARVASVPALGHASLLLTGLLAAALGARRLRKAHTAGSGAPV